MNEDILLYVENPVSVFYCIMFLILNIIDWPGRQTNQNFGDKTFIYQGYNNTLKISYYHPPPPPIKWGLKLQPRWRAFLFRFLKKQLCKTESSTCALIQPFCLEKSVLGVFA